MSEASFSLCGGHSGDRCRGNIPFRWGKARLRCCAGRPAAARPPSRASRMASRRISTKDEIGTVRVCGLDVAHAELWETARFVGSVFQNPKTQFYNVDVRGKSPSDARTWDSEPADIERRVDASAKEFNLTSLIDESLFFSLGRSEAARGVRKRRGFVSRARRAGRAVV